MPASRLLEHNNCCTFIKYEASAVKRGINFTVPVLYKKIHCRPLQCRYCEGSKMDGVIRSNG